MRASLPKVFPSPPVDQKWCSMAFNSFMYAYDTGTGASGMKTNEQTLLRRFNFLIGRLSFYRTELDKGDCTVYSVHCTVGWVVMGVKSHF